MKLRLLTIALLLCALMLAGCTSNSPETSPGGEPSPAASPSPADTSSEPQSSSDGYQKGTVTETSYESAFIGISFTAPDGYLMATEEELAVETEFDGEAVYTDEEKTVLDFAKASVVYEMMVSAPEGAPNVSVMVEKLPLSAMTEKQYLDNIKPQLMEILEYTFSEYTTETIAGEDYTTLSAVAEIDDAGTEIVQNIYIRKKDGRIIGIISSFTNDLQAETDALLAAFVKLP